MITNIVVKFQENKISTIIQETWNIEVLYDCRKQQKQLSPLTFSTLNRQANN